MIETKVFSFQVRFSLEAEIPGVGSKQNRLTGKESLDDGVTKLFAPLLFTSSANSTVADSKGKINLFFRLFAKVTVHRVMEMKVKETKQLYGRIYGRMVLYV